MRLNSSIDFVLIYIIISNKEAIVLYQKGNGSSEEAIEEDTKGLQEHSDNTESSRTIDIEFTLTLEDVRRCVLTLFNPYMPSTPIWFNAKIDIRTGKVIVAHTGRIPVTDDNIPTQFGN